MSLFEQFPSELKLPELTPLPDGRYRMTRYLQFPAPRYVAPAYGSLFERDAQLTGDEAARYSGMRLINVDPSTVPGKQSVPALILTYEQIHATEETQVGKLVTVTDENERDVVQAKFIQFSSAPRTPGTIGTTTPPGVATAVLDNEQAEDEGILRKITRRYVQAGASFAQVGEDEIDYELNGLKRRTRNLIAKGGVVFSGVVGTTTHPTDTGLILAGISVRESQATTKVKATYLEPGTLSIGKRSLNEGVVQYSYVFLGTEGAVTGTVLSRNTGDYQGLRTYNVATAANKDGSTLVGVGGAAKLAYSFPKLVTFQAPGVVDIKEFQSGASISAFADLASPVEFLVSARIYVYYQTSDALVSGDFTTNSAEGLWNPSQWASKEATITAGVTDQGNASGAYYNQQALRGYRVSAVAAVSGAAVTYESTGKTISPSVVKLDESAGELINGRPVYRGVIQHLVDSMNQATVAGGGVVIYRSGHKAKGVISLTIYWTGAAWVLSWSRVITDTMPTTGSGDGIYVYRQATKAWVDSYTNRTSSIGAAILHTATGDTPTPFTATWPAGISLPPPSQSQSVFYAGSPISSTFGLSAVGAWIEGRNVTVGGLGTMTISGGPSNPTGRTFTLGVDFKRALEDVDGNQIYQKTITVATITPA